MTEVQAGDIKRRKPINSDRRRYLTRKFQQVVERFKKKGGDDDTSEEDEEEMEEDGSDAELELPAVIGDSLNLSKKNLKNFPEEVLEKIHQVQYLYLEGNKLTELPQNFFQSLFVLKWLDLRNNGLTSLPTNGLKQHPCLEVILLQGNRMRNLPVELATIPSLRGLQITGNPITNVPYEIIRQGFDPIKKYLEKLYSQEEVSLPVSNAVVKPSTSQDPAVVPLVEVNEPTDSEMRMWDLDKLSQWRHFMKKKSENRKESNFQSCTTRNANERAFSQQPKVKGFPTDKREEARELREISVSLRSQQKPPAKPLPFRCGVYNRNRHKSTASALRYLKMRKTTLGYKKKPLTVAMIQEKARIDAYRAQVRETLEKQAKKIQRMRDKDVLRNWRDHAKVTSQQIKLLDNYQQYPSKDFSEKTPFDVDPEFLNMLNRIDIYRSLKDYDNRSKRKKKAKVKITAQELERQMSEIIKKLKELDTNDDRDNNSPRTRHSHVCSKMHKIMDIQKTLKSLQKLNSSMSGITPIIRSKVKE